jgi:DNA-binding NtrC family response regulator
VSPAPPRILVVDDDVWLVRTQCDVLRHRGFDPHGVYSGEDALAAVESQEWAAVVMDVKMGGMSGVDVVKALHRARVLVPVILTTAYAQSETFRDADDSGVERVLVKPFSPQTLLRALEMALRGDARVMLVDDDPAFLKTLGDCLAERGWRTLRARTVEAAVELLQRHPTRLVLLDLLLNGARPMSAAGAIRDASPTVPLVLYSGHGELLTQAAATLPAGWFRAVVDRSSLLSRLPELIGSA